MNKADREDLIQRLADDFVNSALSDSSWIRDIARAGFGGFDNMSDDDLVRAATDAGLTKYGEYDPDDEPDDPTVSPYGAGHGLDEGGQ